MAPLDVSINGLGDTVNAGTVVTLECRAVGSHPPAELTWWRAGKRLSRVTKAVGIAYCRLQIALLQLILLNLYMIFGGL